MTCPRCHGKREISFDPPLLMWKLPCPTCHGTGTVDCCDGDVAQPEEGE